MAGKDLIWTSPEPVTSEANVTVPCAIFDGQVNLCDIYYGVVRFTACVSMISCFSIIFLIWVFKGYMVFAQRQILYLALSVLLISFSSMTTLSSAGPFCTFKGWAHTYFYWNEISWICCITFNLYINAVWNRYTEKFEWAYHLVSWGLTFIICLIPIFTQKYGPAGLWCSIVGDWRWRFGLWYCPRYILIVILFVIYIYTMVIVNKHAKSWGGLYDPQIEREKEYVKPLKAYPFIYLAVSVFPLVNRIQNAISSKPIFALYLLQGISANLHGFFNVIVYWREMRSQISLAQIKVAFASHFSRKSTLISEYPTTPSTDVDPQTPEYITVHV